MIVIYNILIFLFLPVFDASFSSNIIKQIPMFLCACIITLQFATMNTKFFFTLLLILIAVRAQYGKGSPMCPANHIWNTGCVKLCTHPDFKDCGGIFPAIYNPSFCALSKSGKWNSETFACAACKRPDVIGVKDGKCSCQQEGCPSGQQCKNGACNPIKLPPVIPPVKPPGGGCAAVTCLTGFKCVFGKCIPGPGYCDQNTDCQSYEFCLQNKCTDRCATMRCASGSCSKGVCVPPVKQCRYSYECPRGLTCNAQGKCVDKCQGVICIATSRCIDGQCVPLCLNTNCDPGYQCYNQKCVPIPGYCKSSNDCKVNQICHLNRCVDFCSVTQCPKGTTCQGNKCVPISQCTNSKQCPYGKKCINGKCVDNCDRVLCPVNSRCVNGKCIPNDGYCYSDSQCSNGNSCVNGRCVNKCSLILCSPGFICINGDCIQKPQCNYNYECSYDKKCVNNQCVDRCYGVTCPYGQACQNGNCVITNPCAAIKCYPGSRCQNGKCIPIYPTCFADSDCKDQQICSANKCIDKCSAIRCSSGFICEYGKCIPLCSKIICPVGSKCIDGKCQTQHGYCRKDDQCKSDQICVRGYCVNKCSKIFCPPGTYCLDGQCKLDLNICPVDADYTATVCTDPRPTLKTCPVIYYFVKPADKYCGVTKDGDRIPFVRSCEACLNTSIDYYFDTPCYQVPFVCQKNEKCLDYYCSLNGCLTDQHCPYDWQTCSDGQCIDRCTYWKCRDCKYGKCGYVEPYGDCRQDSDCADQSWSCIDWKCADQCWNVRCPKYHICERGQCKPIQTVKPLH